jgi:hypothetical protein
VHEDNNPTAMTPFAGTISHGSSGNEMPNQPPLRLALEEVSTTVMRTLAPPSTRGLDRVHMYSLATCGLLAAFNVVASVVVTCLKQHS